MTDTPNGKVTLALVKQSIDTLIRTESEHYKDLRAMIDGQAGCVRALEIDAGKHDESIKVLKADVASLEQKSNTWSMLNSVAIAVATFIGIQK